MRRERRQGGCLALHGAPHQARGTAHGSVHDGVGSVAEHEQAVRRRQQLAQARQQPVTEVLIGFGWEGAGHQADGGRQGDWDRDDQRAASWRGRQSTSAAAICAGREYTNQMSPATILVVDDEQLIRWTLKQQLSSRGFDVVEAGSGAEALAAFGDAVDLVLLDFRLPDTDGLAVLRQLKELQPTVPVILLTAFASIQSAVEAIKQGAYDYAKKPFEFDELLLTIGKALETSQLRREVKALRARDSEPHAFDRVIGESTALMTVKAVMAKVAASPASTVLLQGETGTGKDLAAKAIHYNSDRAGRPFVNITCSALPEHLLESELFGHERGAFTDARQQKRGLFETAAGGTIFLDEIGEMSPTLQAKLLRFLEEKTFKRVGGLSDLKVDVRVIAATHRNLAQYVRDGKFREDLYYRLGVMPITLPPLRERTGDVPLLADHFLRLFNREFKKHVKGVAPARPAIARGVCLAGQRARAAQRRGAGDAAGRRRHAGPRALLDAAGDARRSRRDSPCRPKASISRSLERDLLVQALQRAQGNQTQAAQLLGMNRDQIRYRLEKFGLDKLGRSMTDDKSA